MTVHKDAAIVGIYEYPYRVIDGKSPWEIKAECARLALEDAGLGWQDVDALYDAAENGMGAGFTAAEYFGLHPKVMDTTAVGGSSFEFHAAHARRAIREGKANVALLTYGSTSRSQSNAIGTGGRVSERTSNPVNNMENPWGLVLVGNYAMAARRHMYQYGTTPEQLAEIAVTTRYHATRNPDAVRGLADMGIHHTGELSVDDVIASKMVADPLHVLDCCLISDGGGAVVIAGSGVVPSTRRRPAWIAGTGEAIGYRENESDLTVTAATVSGAQAFREASIRPDDIDVAMIYDSFTITVLMTLEDLGFCKKGEGGAYVANGYLRYDNLGGPALNTDGGGLSSNHPGMRGIFLLIEAVRQIRGESTSQVDNPAYCLAHGNGGWLTSRHASGTVILAR